MRKLIEISLLALSLPILMGAQVYRWVDPNGVVNFTQLKPPGVDAQQITTGTSGHMVVAEAADEPAGMPGAAQTGEEKLSAEQQSMLQDLKAAELARQEEVARIREANCAKARSVLDRLSATERIRVRDASGVERIMGEDERQRRINEAQRGVAENCTS